MKKINFSKQTLIATLVALGSLTVTTQAHACKRWDVGCKIREAAKRAREAAEREAERIDQARRQAEQFAKAQATDARRAAEQAAAQAVAQAAALKQAEELATRAAMDAANRLAEMARRNVPVSPNEALNFANSQMNQLGNSAQGVALTSFQATASGLTRVGNDINAAFRSVGDELESELKKLNVAIPDVADFANQAMRPALNELKSFDAFRRTVSNNYAKLDKEDVATIWGVMRTVMEQKRPSEDQIEDITQIMRDLFGDMSNGCTICPKSGRSSVGFAVTVATPTAGQVPVSGSASFSLMMSTYPVNGKPLFVSGYTVSSEASAQPRLTPEVVLDVVWSPGELTTSRIPSITLGVGMSTPSVATPYGTYSGGGGVGLTMPDTVFKFFDKGERRKLLAALKDPSRGPNWVVQQANAAINDLRKMVMNPAVEAGISIGLPGTDPISPPDGGMSLSLSGVIGAF